MREIWLSWDAYGRGAYSYSPISRAVAQRPTPWALAADLPGLIGARLTAAVWRLHDQPGRAG